MEEHRTAAHTLWVSPLESIHQSIADLPVCLSVWAPWLDVWMDGWMCGRYDTKELTNFFDTLTPFPLIHTTPPIPLPACLPAFCVYLAEVTIAYLPASLGLFG